MLARAPTPLTPASPESARAGADTEADALIAAMVGAAAAEGYAGVSVARVLARAGVSRRAFYRHFASRDACFLAAYRVAAAKIGARIAAAARSGPPRERPRTVVAALLCWIEEEPAAARLFLLEALAACPAVRVEHERLLAGFERSIERFLGDADAPALRAPASALLGGVCGVVSARLLAGGSDFGEGLLADLTAWVHSYECTGVSANRSPGNDSWWEAAVSPRDRGRRPRGGEIELLPRGRSALPPAAVGSARRARILAATMRQTAAKGYARLTVADIVAEARVPRAAFYSQFDGKLEAFLAAQTLGLRESVAAAAAEFVTGGSWPERVWLGLAALLDYLAAHPDLARLCLVEVHAAGHAAVLRMQENRGAYAIFLAEGYRQGERPPPHLCSEAVISAIEAILRRYVAAGRAERLREALPACAYVSLAPFIGPGRASEWVAGRVRAAD